MHLEVRGHPLHTRSLAIVVAQRADGKLDVYGSILDLRKRGFVPVGGDLQGPGVIHDMRLAAVVDPDAARIETIRAEQPAVAFDSSAATGGESCRDPVRAVEALDGARLDRSFARRAGAAIGGIRGCSHLLTLAHLLGSTTAWALALERTAHGAAPARPPGQRVFRRDVVIDGHEPDVGRLALATQLTDLHFAPAPPLARPMERFAGQLECRLLAEVDLTRMHLARLSGAERRRGPADLAAAPWRSHDDVLAGLAGLALGPGVTAALLERLGGRAGDRPLLDALLMLAPALIQCSAALSEAWIVAAQRNPGVAGIGGLPDSCYMWRRDGVLQRTREREGAPVPMRPEA